MSIGAILAVPELQAEGPARTIAAKLTNLQVRFFATGAEMVLEERRTVRYVLMPGTRIIALPEEGGSAAPADPAAPAASAGYECTISTAPPTRDGTAMEGLLIYGVVLADGSTGRVREDAITMVLAPRDAEEQLRTVAFHDLRATFAPAGSRLAPEPWGALTFCAREELMQWRDDAWALTGSIIGLSGARVRPLPHQLITAQRVLADRQVRFLLADEVGLGKTIEAGLIMQSLLAMRPGLRVLVVVPGALLSQWFLELFVKFGGRRFVMLDHERLETYAGNPWADEQFVLASSRAIEELDGKGALRLAQSHWDLLVVDECHRMQPGGLLYKRVTILSKSTPHVLLLSATPARQHVDAYLALLTLLQPLVYRPNDVEAFKTKVAIHARVVELLSATRDGTHPSAPAVAQRWRDLLGADRLLTQRANALEASTPADYAAARDGLVGYIREHHQLDSRIIRHRRSVLARLSQASGVKGLESTTRVYERVGYRPDKHELAVRSALAHYSRTLIDRHASSKSRAAAASATLPPRLAHWLLQLELAVGAGPSVLERLLAMRSAVTEEPHAYEEYRKRAGSGESTASVLRNDLSESESMAHIAVSAASFADASEEPPVLQALIQSLKAWSDVVPARVKALIARLKRFWQENPQEKVLVFTGHGLAVKPLAEHLAHVFGDEAVETFGAHQDTLVREESARRFRDDDNCPLLVCDPLGGEGRNFQFVSVVAHHDLPWSVASVEQRIGRVDRLGRDGEVPSWVLVAEDQQCVDAAWADVLQEAVGVFSASSSGLEFVSDELETRALMAGLCGGAPALRAQAPDLVRLVASERAHSDARVDELFQEQSEVYVAVAALAQRVESAGSPKDAVCRWIRGMGGSARRDEEPPRAFHLRTRLHQQAEGGVFQRDEALSRPDLAFFALGNSLIDRMIDDADRSAWCSAAAWRRQPTSLVKQWEGLRVAYRLTLDLAPLAAQQLPLDCLRRLLVVAPPRRLVAFIHAQGARLEEDAAVLEVLKPGFDPRRGDRALSLSTSREFWTKPLLGGKHAQVLEWQSQISQGVAAAKRYANRLLPGERDPALASFTRRCAESLEVVRARLASAEALFAGDHPEVTLARQELAEEEKQSHALTAALAGATLEIVSVASIAVA